MQIKKKGEITFLTHSQDWQDSKKKARTKSLLPVEESPTCIPPIYMLNRWEILLR